MIVKIKNSTEDTLKINYQEHEVIIKPQMTYYVNSTYPKLDLLVTEAEIKPKNRFVEMFSYVICCAISFVVICINCFEFPVAKDFFTFPTKLSLECSENTEINLIIAKNPFNICSFQIDNDVFEGECIFSDFFYKKKKRKFLKEIFLCTTFPLCLFLLFAIIGVLKKEWSLFVGCILIFLAIVFFIMYYYKKSSKKIQQAFEKTGDD